jgi:DNA-binding transcriptional LysR family regulator
MALDLESVRVFVRVAEAGNLTRAAQQLGVPKARVSHRLAQLEAELGCELVQRTTRMARLTEEGSRFLERARPLLADADEVEALFRPGRRAEGRVRLDLPVAFARRVVLPHLGALLDEHPALEVVLSLTDRRIEAIREGFDVVLRIGPAHEPGLVGRRVGELAMVNAASASYLARFGTPHALSDLDEHLIVHYASNLGAEAPSFEYVVDGKVEERPVRARVTVNNTDAYSGAAAAGLGIVQIPRVRLYDPASADLVEVLPDHVPPPLPVWLLHTHGARVPHRVRVVLDWLFGVVSGELGGSKG